MKRQCIICGRRKEISYVGDIGPVCVDCAAIEARATANKNDSGQEPQKKEG